MLFIQWKALDLLEMCGKWFDARFWRIPRISVAYWIKTACAIEIETLSYLWENLVIRAWIEMFRKWERNGWRKVWETSPENSEANWFGWWLPSITIWWTKRAFKSLVFYFMVNGAICLLPFAFEYYANNKIANAAVHVHRWLWNSMHIWSKFGEMEFSQLCKSAHRQRLSYTHTAQLVI